MRSIEQQLIGAILARQPFSGGNTAYSPAANTVTLHGNLIARYTDTAGWQFNLSGWNTPTTRSRINALASALRPGGSRVYQKDGDPMSDGRVIGQNEWF